ncbi:MAG: acyl-CoA thioesterase [Bdellovibrionales bacterium]|jgi:acyl-CoA hydrolase|nr:acyl-CoA thioesterase [Bdellovibrionales bacterium]
MTEMILPSHTNSLDSVFGGVIMSWIDICAAISALRHCNRPVVTASIDAVNFMAPAYKGWIVTLVSSVNYVSRTSMEVGVRVEAEHLVQNEKFQIASAYLTFVALDDNGKPMPVPKVIPQSVEEKRRYEAAKKRRELRLQTKK